MTTTTRPEATPGAAPEPEVGSSGVVVREGRWLDHWDPENAAQWEGGGRSLARRNLAVSILAEFLGFAVWALWSIVVPQLNTVGFSLDQNQMFWLISIPALVGATLRVPYTFAVPRFGGRNWTIISALLLLLPVVALALVVQHPQTPFGVLVLVAALAGVGGGNFASSMTNINFFYPEAEKGRALGLNAAGGNLGTAFVQFTVPIVITIGAGVHLDRAGWLFVPLVLVAALLAWRVMHNVTAAKADPRSFAQAARMPHTWIISVIYIGTFGSFIGFSGAFPTLLAKQFPEVTLSLAFLGALVGSVTRPLGGMAADRFGGMAVTVASFAVMALGALGAIAGLSTRSFALFFGSFLLLFVFTGVGNGSVYRMIPAVFRVTNRDSTPEGMLTAKRIASGCLGIAGAVGAFGGFLIPRGFALSTQLTGTIIAALVGMIAVYLVLAAVTWCCYGRKGTELGDAHI